MSERELKRAFLKGYEEGFRDAWEELVKLVSKGHSPQELRMIAKSRLSMLSEKVEEKSRAVAVEDLEESEEKPLPGEVLLNPGESCICAEPRPERSFSLFLAALDQGRRGLCIARTHPDSTRRRYGLEGVRIIWLTKSEDVTPPAGDRYLSPTNLVVLASAIKEFLDEDSGGVIVFEGLEYLITQNGFESILKFIQRVNEYVMTSGGIMLVSANPEAMAGRQYKLLAREMSHEI